MLIAQNQNPTAKLKSPAFMNGVQILLILGALEAQNSVSCSSEQEEAGGAARGLGGLQLQMIDGHNRPRLATKLSILVHDAPKQRSTRIVPYFKLFLLGL